MDLRLPGLYLGRFCSFARSTGIRKHHVLFSSPLPPFLSALHVTAHWRAIFNLSDCPPLANLYLGHLYVRLFSKLSSHEAIEVKGRSPQVQIEKHPDGVGQHFTDEPMLKVPETMNANAGHSKPFGQVRADRFDYLTQPRTDLEQRGACGGSSSLCKAGSPPRRHPGRPAGRGGRRR